MHSQFILFRRGGIYYCEDTTTGKQTSLRTRDEKEARNLLHAKKEALRQPVLNLKIARTYKCDIVEQHRGGTLCPVEYKKGKRRLFDNDDAQLCAQALCLEEMFQIAIPRGAIFHADSKRRRDVEFNLALRAKAETAVTALHALLNPQPAPHESQLPVAVYKPACEECSLFNICLPKATEAESRNARLAHNLFRTA